MSAEQPDDLLPAPNAKVRPDDARGTPPGAGTVAPPHGGRIGNAPFVATQDQRDKVRQYAKTFPQHARHYIARLVGVSVSTLDRHFADEMELGRAEMLATIGGQLVARAMNVDAVNGSGERIAKGDLDAQKFVMARLGGWSTKVEVAGKNGGPIQTADLSRLSPEQLEAYGRLAAAAEGQDPDAVVGDA